MQDLKLTFTYLSGLAIGNREVFREDLSKLDMGSMSENHSLLSMNFRRQTILPTEGVERRERRVGGLGPSFSRLLVCPLPEGYNASEISVVNNMLFRNRGIYYSSIIVRWRFVW